MDHISILERLNSQLMNWNKILNKEENSKTKNWIKLMEFWSSKHSNWLKSQASWIILVAAYNLISYWLLISLPATKMLIMSPLYITGIQMANWINTNKLWWVWVRYWSTTIMTSKFLCMDLGAKLDYHDSIATKLYIVFPWMVLLRIPKLRDSME